MVIVELYFSGKEEAQLHRIGVLNGSHKRASVRGKDSNEPGVTGSFQWTSAVKALCLLLLRQSLSPSIICLKGEKGSAASTLDYAISKEPRWLLDLFEAETSLRKAFSRDNPEQKRAEPVSVSLSPHFWLPIQINVFYNAQQIQNSFEILTIAETLEYAFECKGKSGQPENHTGNPLLLKVWKNKFKVAIEQEIVDALSGTAIFSTSESESIVSNIHLSKAFLKASGGRTLPDRLVGKDLSSISRLGIDLEVLKEQRLRVSLAFPDVSTQAIFCFLKYNKGYSIDLQVKHPHAVDIARQLVDHSLETDLCALGTAPSATVLANQERVPYEPIMILPRVSQQIVAHSESASSELSSGKYLFIGDDPSIPQFMFSDMIQDGVLRSSAVSTRSLEPDETFKELSKGDTNARAILFFPHFHFNQWFNSAKTIADPRPNTTNQEFILFGHRSLMKQPETLLAINVAIRDAWLSLLLKPTVRKQIVSLIVEDEEYLDYIARCSGLYSMISGKV